MFGLTQLHTHDLATERLSLNLDAAMVDLREGEPRGHDRRSVTLLRQSGLIVVLTMLETGAALQEHTAPGAVTIQVLDGRANVRVADETIDAGPGHLIAFDANVPHAVEAVDACTLLITIAQPSA